MDTRKFAEFWNWTQLHRVVHWDEIQLHGWPAHLPIVSQPQTEVYVHSLRLCSNYFEVKCLDHAFNKTNNML